METKNEKKINEVYIKLDNHPSELISFVELMRQATIERQSEGEDKDAIISHLNDIIKCLEIVSKVAIPMEEEPKDAEEVKAEAMPYPIPRSKIMS